MSDTRPAIFTLDELWLLQSVVRHEVPQGLQNWSYPPASVTLNDAIAAGILFCTVHNAPDAAVEMSRHDCLVVDYALPASAKDAAGRLAGKAILLKTFAIRAQLALGEDGSGADEPQGLPSAREVCERLAAKKDDHNADPG